jgi:hypothetical protein
MSTENEALVLSDSAIAQVAKVLQVALLTGTDIVDHLRMMRLVNENGSLVLDKDYDFNFQNGLDRMIEEVSKEDTPEDDDG